MPKITLSATSVKASPSRRRRRCQTVYRVRNWAAYDAGLKQRGSLTLWLSPQAIKAWYYQGPTRRGSSYTYSALAIQTALMMRLLFHLPLRQTEGFLSSILELMGVDLAVPDHTTLSRRHADLKVALPVQPRHEPMHLVVDSTGLKVYGEGEWKVRQHGWRKRRTWRKWHIGVHETTGEIVAQTLTSAGQDDASQVAPLLDPVPTPVQTFTADGAYDKRKVFQALANPKQGVPIHPCIPPRRNAKIEQHGNGKAPPLARDETLRVIRRQGRSQWKRTSRYHRRSIVETHLGRYKRRIGRTLRARRTDYQQTEARLGCALLNHLLAIAKPVSYPVEKSA